MVHHRSCECPLQFLFAVHWILSSSPSMLLLPRQSRRGNQHRCLIGRRKHSGTANPDDRQRRRRRRRKWCRSVQPDGIILRCQCRCHVMHVTAIAIGVAWTLAWRPLWLLYRRGHGARFDRTGRRRLRRQAVSIHHFYRRRRVSGDLMQLDLEPGEAPYSQELLHEDLDWIIKNKSNGDFSRDASYFRGNLPIVPDQRLQPSSICVYGNVHDLVVCVQIYMTKYRNVIAFTTPLTPEQSITCYVNDPDTIADFLREYFDKKSITIVLDEPAVDID